MEGEETQRASQRLLRNRRGEGPGPHGMGVGGDGAEAPAATLLPNTFLQQSPTGFQTTSLEESSRQLSS